MEDFLYKHRKLVTVIIVGVVLFFLFFLFTTRPKEIIQPVLDKDQQIGDTDTSFLNYKDTHYSIVSGVDSPDSPQSLTINADPGYRNAAINQIYESSLNPTDYKILFTYKNPFEPVDESAIEIYE